MVLLPTILKNICITIFANSSNIFSTPSHKIKKRLTIILFNPCFNIISVYSRLQKFKLLTANTVISSENAAMETMGTDQLLDLFQLSSGAAAGPPGPAPGPSAPALPPPAGRAVLDALPDLWDDKQYEEEYDMSNFIKGLNKIGS